MGRKRKTNYRRGELPIFGQFPFQIIAREVQEKVRREGVWAAASLKSFIRRVNR